jgi:hypothetical protein
MANHIYTLYHRLLRGRRRSGLRAHRQGHQRLPRRPTPLQGRSWYVWNNTSDTAYVRNLWGSQRGFGYAAWEYSLINPSRIWRR